MPGSSAPLGLRGRVERLVSGRRDAYRSLPSTDRRVFLALGVLVLTGTALRVAFMLAYRPAFLGFPDSSVYATGAGADLFWDPLRAAGYSLFLRLGHALNSNLSLTIVLQHALGIATGLLVFRTMRLIGGPPWLGLVPAAAILLGGDQMFFEHALLSESLYTFLTAAGILAAARCLEGARAAAVTCGVVLAFAAEVRLAGILILGIVVLWLLVASTGTWRGRALQAAFAGGAGGLVLLGYLVAAHDQTGAWSFARHGAYNFYGRTATFADCSKFEEPSGTEALCEGRPADERPSAEWYVFSGPAVGHFGEPQVGSPSSDSLDKVRDFARSAAIHQPGDWLAASARDFARYVSPTSNRPAFHTPSTSEYAESYLTTPDWTARTLDNVKGYWTTDGLFVRTGTLDRLRDYASATRIEGIPLAVLLVLAALAPIVCRGRERRGALLLAGTGWALLVVPVVTITYNGRFAVPAFGFVAGAAALGAWGVGRRLLSRPSVGRAARASA